MIGKRKLRCVSVRTIFCLPEIANSSPTKGWMSLCFSSSTVSRRVHAEGLFICLSAFPKQWGHHSNNLLVTKLLDWIEVCYEPYSRLRCYALSVHGVISLFNSSCSNRNVTDYSFWFYAFPSILLLPFGCSWSCDMRSGKLKSLSDFLAYHHFKMNKCSWRQPAGRELMY